jgi:hypothetical protein
VLEVEIPELQVLLELLEQQTLVVVAVLGLLIMPYKNWNLELPMRIQDPQAVT